jgi:hypothetical protein
MSTEDFVKFVALPEGPEKFATILSGETKQLVAMDRYERRALSRRKIAIQAFDDVRRGHQVTTTSCSSGRTKPK